LKKIFSNRNETKTPEFSSFRYDCRSHLFDLTPWDSDLIRSRKTNSNDEEIFDENQRQIEIECEKERYADLYRDVDKEIENKEEEEKRISLEKNSFGQVPFSYDESTTKSDEVPPPPPPPAPDDDEYEPFYPSEKLQIPYGMEIPESIKQHAVIEKTANFVSNSGLQMEIVLKTKQSNNRQFDFLKYDHILNPYYRHLIIMIKSGKYRPNVDQQATKKNGIDPNSSHDEDEGGDSYLHPLLRGGSTTTTTNDNAKIPSIPMNIHNTAYGQLIKKYEHLRQKEKIDEEKMSIGSEESSPLPAENSPSPSPSASVVIPPPPDVKPIIDKLAEYVARNGPAFEQSIRTKNDSRFGFLERDHLHHNYYLLKVQMCSSKTSDEPIVSDQRVKLVFKSTTSNDESENSKRKVFDDDEQNEFIGPRPPSPDFIEKMRKQEQRRDRAAEFVREKLLKEKQEERKRKAELLIQNIKNQPNDESPTPTVNPILVEKLLNVKNDRSNKQRRRSRSRSSHRRTKRSSHHRSKSRSRYRSKRSKTSKSSRDHHGRRRRHHRRRRRSSSSSSTTSKSTSKSKSSGSSSSRSSSSSSTLSSNDRDKKNNNKDKEKKNSKWDQREPIKVKNETTITNSNSS